MSKKEKKKCTSVGGQAVIGGVMMMGKSAMATAVRDSDDEIQIEAKRLHTGKHLRRALKVPFLRGVISFVLSLTRGTKTLLRSAAVYGDDEEEPGRIQKWVAEKLKVNLIDVITCFSAIFGIVLAVGLFIFLPQFLVGLLSNYTPIDEKHWAYYTILGVLKLIIFIGYLSAILFMKEIRRLYMYHGAEHKTINAYEHGAELTPESVKQYSRLHDRCGTSFLFIVLFINVVIISAVNWAFFTYVLPDVTNKIYRFLLKFGIELVLLPVIAGVSYEILKFLAKFDNKFVGFFKAPGRLIQKALTTREPDEEMIEVAIAAFKKVLEMDADESVPETEFVTGGVLSKMLADTKEKFAAAGIDESDAEWIYSIALKIKRDELKNERVVLSFESKSIHSIVEKRLAGRPLWYIIGDTDFHGCKIKVDERVLIPRPETELLADFAIKTVEEGDKVLDLCTGSGCIAIAIAKHCAQKRVSVTASDFSDAAILLARENARLNGVNIEFVQSDLFTSVRGRYNLIVCNPPYVKSSDIPALQKEVREHEPKIALDGGADGLDFYRRIARVVRSYLAKDGALLLEYGEGQADDILKLFERRDYAMVMKDLSGTDRFIKIVF